SLHGLQETTASLKTDWRLAWANSFRHAEKRMAHIPINISNRLIFARLTEFELIAGERAHDDDFVGQRQVKRTTGLLVKHILLQRAVMQELDMALQMGALRPHPFQILFERRDTRL